MRVAFINNRAPARLLLPTISKKYCLASLIEREEKLKKENPGQRIALDGVWYVGPEELTLNRYAPGGSKCVHGYLP